MVDLSCVVDDGSFVFCSFSCTLNYLFYLRFCSSIAARYSLMNKPGMVLSRICFALIIFCRLCMEGIRLSLIGTQRCH